MSLAQLFAHGGFSAGVRNILAVKSVKAKMVARAQSVTSGCRCFACGVAAVLACTAGPGYYACFEFMMVYDGFCLSL